MTDRRSRLVLIGLASILSLKLVYQGHHGLPSGPSVAFVHYRPTQVLVRLRGDLPIQGVFTFPRGTTVAGVIKLTSLSRCRRVEGLSPETLLMDGDIYDLRRKSDLTVTIIQEKMTTGERILFGIPLNPDKMSVADWEALPGIGPALARDIVADRQKNGAFRSVSSLTRVPGVGEKKVQRIARFF